MRRAPPPLSFLSAFRAFSARSVLALARSTEARRVAIIATRLSAIVTSAGATVTSGEIEVGRRSDLVWPIKGVQVVRTPWALDSVASESRTGIATIPNDSTPGQIGLAVNQGIPNGFDRPVTLR